MLQGLGKLGQLGLKATQSGAKFAKESKLGPKVSKADSFIKKHYHRFAIGDTAAGGAYFGGKALMGKKEPSESEPFINQMRDGRFSVYLGQEVNVFMDHYPTAKEMVKIKQSILRMGDIIGDKKKKKITKEEREEFTLLVRMLAKDNGVSNIQGPNGIMMFLPDKTPDYQGKLKGQDKIVTSTDVTQKLF